MESAFDRKAFNNVEANAKKMVQAHYEYCLAVCNEEPGKALAPCKQECYHSIIVPWKIVLHQSMDSEENLYR